jgi:hypothetical protein
MREWSDRDPVHDQWDEADDKVDEPPPSAWRTLQERRRAWVPLVILIVGLVLLLYSMQLGSVTTSGYDLQRLQAERAEWRQRNEQLELELAKVQSLAWIEVEAMGRLGMQKADRVTYLEMTPPEPAASADIGATPARVPSEARPRASGEESPLDGVLAAWRGLLVHIVPPLDAGP